MAVAAVIFDWGGTLTPWHDVDHVGLWRGVCTAHYDPERAAQVTDALLAAEHRLWEQSATEQRSATLDQIFALAGVTATPEFLASYYAAWDPHTITDPEAAELLTTLRSLGIRVGVLSNTMWPRERHELIFARDGVLDLIDGAVYSCEIPWTKPHPEAFRAAMAAVGAEDAQRCVFVGDRPFDDVHGARQAGMRTVLVPHSSVPAFPEAKPDAVISRLRELGPLLSAW
jgi:putative hydrolase of the HAD superfamily